MTHLIIKLRVFRDELCSISLNKFRKVLKNTPVLENLQTCHPFKLLSLYSNILKNKIF